MHLTREILFALSEGEITVEEAFLLSHSHLMDACPTCRHEAEEYSKIRQELSQLEEGTQVRPPALLRMISRSRPEPAPSAAVAQEATAWMMELESTRVETWADTIREQEEGFLGPAFARQLLDRARAAGPSDPNLIIGYAKAAYEACLRSSSERHDLIAQALALAGNGKRIQGEYKMAEATFLMLNLNVLPQVSDPRSLAEISSLNASLELELGRYPKCKVLLMRALTYYSLLDDGVGEAKVRANLCSLFYFQRQPLKAIEYLMPALVFDLRDEPRLVASLYHNLARAQIEIGYLEEADFNLSAAEQLSQHLTGYEKIYPRWTRGRLLIETGDYQKAEESLQETQRALTSMNRRLDTAIATCDLARCYLRQGLKESAISAIQPALVMLTEDELPKEAQIYVDQLKDASLQHAVTEAVVLEISKAFEAISLRAR